jgi:hypothetical protein
MMKMSMQSCSKLLAAWLLLRGGSWRPKEAESLSEQPHHLTYQFAGQAEQCLAFGDYDASTRRILLVPPLFDEMNRVRRTWVQAMRILADKGITSALPDLPGCNESSAPLAEQSLSAWREATAEAAKAFSATHIFSVRGGCLIDEVAGLPVMRLAPVKGASILKAIIRTRIAGDKEAGVITSADALAMAVQQAPVELAGNLINMQMWQELESAVPAASPNATDFIPDSGKSWTLWLRAEPQYDAEIAAGLALAIEDWSAA